MKHIRNWKSVATEVKFSDAINVLREQRFRLFAGPVMVKSNASKRSFETYDPKASFTLPEIEGTFVILIPDTDEENKNNKIREYLKNTNISGLKHEKIDNMTTNEIWDYINQYLLKDEQKYRMLLYYFENKIYSNH